jgi:hypothetical protein
MEQYLTVKELSILTKLRVQTIYNMIYRGEFVLNTHFYKPTAKILFIWSAIKAWLEGGSGNGSKGDESGGNGGTSPTDQGVNSPQKSTTQNKERSSIRI